MSETASGIALDTTVGDTPTARVLSWCGPVQRNPLSAIGHAHGDSTFRLGISMVIRSAGPVGIGDTVHVIVERDE
jgi:hypothetical protein